MHQESLVSKNYAQVVEFSKDISQSILDKWAVCQQLWDKMLGRRVDPEVIPF